MNNSDNLVGQFKELIERSSSILITSHISPDPDAICSVLLLGTTLKFNYPDKKLDIVLEEKPTRDLNFLEGYKTIRFQPLLEFIQADSPELLIILDGNNYNRVSRTNGSQLQNLAGSGSVKTAAVDHHEEADKAEFDVFINNHSPATTQDVYTICFNDMNLQKPSGYADTAMLGIISDSNRFKYANPLHRQTFTIVSDLIDAGANIEKLESKLRRYSTEQMAAIAHLSENLVVAKNYNYTYIDDDFAKQIKKMTDSYDAVKIACEEFANTYIRSIANNYWGFIVYPELVMGEHLYSVSFRSISGVKDVSEIALRLGGGGHKPAAGAKIKAGSVEEAIKNVRLAISGAVDED